MSEQTGNEAKGRSIVAYTDRGRWVKSNVRNLATGAGLAFLATRKGANFLIKTISSTSRGLLMVWGLGNVPALFHMLSTKPLVVVDEEGIRYNLPALGPIELGGFLPWNEIVGLYLADISALQQGKAQKVLCVLPRNKETFLQRGSLVTRKVRGFMNNMVGSPFCILDSGGVTLSPEEILNRIRTSFADKLEEHRIVLGDERKVAMPR
ncbi:hypothetical protein EI42_00651 [Thermosporothrix hazakensis]|uniref:Uncharacterized protein n=1 Tax=Thermosporothrix hazakensis TaxID=644383 RepID=A0A326UDE9_THEHA|nr:hypothetical protein [Thermosporothrix hazakensis]PZW36477.1 hypothetical protein EI42_00651 [Thermosporothrix hazakensis]GCE47131.1 hypothetical protein KTH_20000 [Thermosporothrix hazakensis]